MSKRLPYFQFEPAEYLAGDIMFCSYASQGIFNNICALYWQKDCQLSYSQLIKRLGNEELIKELIQEKIIKVDKDAIIINFLDEQYNKATSKSNVNSENGKKGALKRWRKDSESIATPLNNNSESIALREDNIKEDNITITSNVGVIEFNDSFNICLFDEQWKEDIERMYKVDKDKIKFALNEFKTHCGTIGENKPKTLNQFKKHFTNWVRVKKQYQVKTENKDRL